MAFSNAILQLFTLADFSRISLSRAISFTVGFVTRKRPFSTEAQIGLSDTVEKGLFRLNFFRLSFPTGGSSRKLDFSTGSVSRKTRSKQFYTCFLNPSHRSSHHKTHTHTPIHPYQVPHSSIIQQRRRCLGYHCCCFSPQVSMAHSELRSPAACITRQQQ